MTLHLAPLLSALLSLVGAALLGAIPIVTRAFLKRVKIRQGSDQWATVMRAAEVLGGNVYKALAHAGASVQDVHITNAAVGDAAALLATMVPNEIAALGLTPERVAQLVAGAFGKLLAVDPSVSLAAPLTLTSPLPPDAPALAPPAAGAPAAGAPAVPTGAVAAVLGAMILAAFLTGPPARATPESVAAAGVPAISIPAMELRPVAATRTGARVIAIWPASVHREAGQASAILVDFDRAQREATALFAVFDCKRHAFIVQLIAALTMPPTQASPLTADQPRPTDDTMSPTREIPWAPAAEAAACHGDQPI